MRQQTRLVFIRGQDPSPLVSASDVAHRFGVRTDTVMHWFWRAHEGVPEPVAYTAAGPIYWWPDWLAWVKVYRPALYEKAMSNEQTTDSGGDEE
jgi:hypothetical protein